MRDATREGAAPEREDVAWRVLLYLAMTHPEDGAGIDRSPKVRTLLALLSVLLIGLSLWMAHAGKQKERALRDMPVAERQALFHRTIESYRAVCVPAPRIELKERCQQDAEFLILFPECDVSCRDLISELLPKPTR